MEYPTDLADGHRLLLVGLESTELKPTNLGLMARVHLIDDHEYKIHS